MGFDAEEREPATPLVVSEVNGAWGVVDLFGHVRVAGLLTEVTIAGAGFLRIDVPGERREEVVVDTRDYRPGPGINARTIVVGPETPAATYFQSPNSVYGIELVTERVARRLAPTFRKAPASRWDFQDADLKPKVRDPMPGGEPSPTPPRPGSRYEDRDARWGPDPLAERDPDHDDGPREF